MFRAFTLALNQMGDPAILKVLAKSLLITLCLCVVLGFLLSHAGQVLLATYAGYATDSYYAVLSSIAVLLVVFFGFRLIAIPVIGVFADEVVAAVERKHYPGRASIARPVSFGLSLRLGLMSALRMILFNLLALPLYILSLLTVVGPFAIFLLVNALLLGRDLGEMVAVRHLDGRASAAWLRTSRGSRLLLGFAGSALFMIPIVNFLAPIVGAAMATHLFHRDHSPFGFGELNV